MIKVVKNGINDQNGKKWQKLQNGKNDKLVKNG